MNAHNKVMVLNSYGVGRGNSLDLPENLMKAFILSSNTHSHVHPKSAYYLRGFKDS